MFLMFLIVLLFFEFVFGPLIAHNSAHSHSPELISKLVISECVAPSFDSNFIVFNRASVLKL